MRAFVIFLTPLIKSGWDSTAMATRQADHKRRHDAIEDTDPAAASVSLRPRSQRRVVPESLIAPKNRRDNDSCARTHGSARATGDMCVFCVVGHLDFFRVQE